MRKILALVLIPLMLWFIAETHVLYPEVGIIVELDYAEDLVTVEDVAGNLWQFYGTEDFCIGDLVRVLMYNAGTPHSIYDDQILIAWYAGTLQQFQEILDK